MAQLIRVLIAALVFVAAVVIVASALLGVLGAVSADARHDQAEAGGAVWLPCEGPCPGPSGRALTVHEPAGDGTATCRTCGTPRRHHP